MTQQRLSLTVFKKAKLLTTLHRSGLDLRHCFPRAFWRGLSAASRPRPRGSDGRVGRCSRRRSDDCGRLGFSSRSSRPSRSSRSSGTLSATLRSCATREGCSSSSRPFLRSDRSRLIMSTNFFFSSSLSCSLWERFAWIARASWVCIFSIFCIVRASCFNDGFSRSRF